MHAISQDRGVTAGQEKFVADNARFFLELLPGRSSPLGNAGGSAVTAPIGVDSELVAMWAGRGWWYDAAAFMASSDRVWIELSGLPPSRLREYYARHSWSRLTRKMIFATDWPGVPGIAANAWAVAKLMPDEETTAAVLAGNAARVHNFRGSI